MIKGTRHLTSGLNRARLNRKVTKPTEASLFVARMKEWDREFTRQTRQLTALSRDLKHKVGSRLTPRDR